MIVYGVHNACIIVALGVCKACYKTYPSIFHSYQPVDVFSINRTSVSSLKIQTLYAEK